MFDIKNTIVDFSYVVQLEEIIRAICDISFDIGTQLQDLIDVSDKDKGFTIEDMFVEAFVKEINVRKESFSDQYNENGVVITPALTKEEFFGKIADYYNKKVFYTKEFLTGLEDSYILFIDKRQTKFFGSNDSANSRLLPALKNAKILKSFISNLKNDKIKLSLEKIDLLENDFFYNSAIKSSRNEGKTILFYIDYSMIQDEQLSVEEVDKFDYWINSKRYNELAQIDISNIEEYKVLRDSNSKEIGLLIGEYLVPYSNVDLRQYVKNENLLDYYWLLLEKSYSLKANPEIIKDDMIKDFKSANNDIELNQLLSYLKNNFYIDDKKLINEKFSTFFNEVVLIEKLDFLSEYQFLMSPEMSHETTLGIYSTEKKGESYNLLHWLNHKTDKKLNHFRKSIPTEKLKKIIHTLKPAICYYFLLKYFEDLFDDILTKNKYKFLANHKFYDKGSETEIDFFINSGNKLFYVETKTKLSKFYIDKFLKKSSTMIDKFKPMLDDGIELDFILIGGYSDGTVSEYQYFIENSEIKEGYNIDREKLNCKPYFFNVPIPDKQGKEIKCIAEPQYSNLQNLVLEICPK